MDKIEGLVNKINNQGDEERTVETISEQPLLKGANTQIDKHQHELREVYLSAHSLAASMKQP